MTTERAFESETERFLANNETYATTAHGPPPMSSSLRTAVVACMDARMDVYRILGLHVGESHVIRNAGGVVTDDVVRSLVISQRLLGTTEVVLVHHTDCGMLTFTDDALRAAIAAETGYKPSYAMHAFDDLAGDVRAGIARIKADPHIPHRDRVRGFIFDVRTGRLDEVA